MWFWPELFHYTWHLSWAAPVKPPRQRRNEMDGWGLVGGTGGRSRRLLMPTRSLSDRHSEAGTAGLHLLQLTGSSGCQAPVGNHLPQQLDYLSWRQDAPMPQFHLSFKTLSSTRRLSGVCLHLAKRECLNFWTKTKVMKAAHFRMIPEMILFWIGVFVFHLQGIAGKPGPRGQRGPTVGTSTVHEPYALMFYTVQIK